MIDRNDSTAFFGKVTASTTHELQNVLAIIKENAGLMEDFIHMGTDNVPDLLDRITKCLGKIKEQAYRGVDLTSGLNGFSHTTDRFCAPVNLYESAKLLIFLTKRVFQQKGVQIVLIPCDAPPSLQTDPVLFQKLLWNCLCLMETLELKTNVVVRILNSDKGKGMEVCCETPPIDNETFKRSLHGSANWTDIQSICKELGLTPFPMTQTSTGIRILLAPLS